MSRSRHGQYGLSLVQLMVALTLGALIATGLIQILVSTKSAYRTQEAQARMQETGRFSTELLGYELRMAGYMGCPNLDRVTPRVTANPAPSPAFTADNFIETYEAGTASWTPSLPTALSSATVGNDVVSIHRGADCSANLSSTMSTESSAVEIATGHGCGFANGDLLMVSDCVNADIFRATTISSTAGTDSISHTSSNNSNTRFTKAYGTDAIVMKLQETSFFVAPGAGGFPALWRQVDAAAPEELVEGVEGMQLLYGEDLNNNLAADRYVTSASAGFDMDNVVSIRLSLLLQTLEENVTLNAQTYTFNGATTTATDGRLRRVYLTTLNLRNRTIE